MSYETSSFSGKVLFHPWALQPSVCPIFSKITPIEREPNSRLVDAVTKQFDTWRQEDFRGFEPNMSSWMVYVMPSLARTLCGLFAGCIAAPVGVFYHGAMVCKEIILPSEPDSREKLEAHRNALGVDAMVFYVTLMAILTPLALPAMLQGIKIRRGDVCQLLSAWQAQGPLVNLALLTTLTASAVFLTNRPSYTFAFDQLQAVRGRDGFRLSQRLHANFGLLDLDGKRLAYSSRDNVLLRNTDKGKITYTLDRLRSLKVSLEIELFLAAIEAKGYIEVPFQYPINGDQVADLLLLEEQEELASKLRKLQYAVSSMDDLLNSILVLQSQSPSASSFIEENLYRSIFNAESGIDGAARLRSLFENCEEKVRFLDSDFINFIQALNQDQLKVFNEKWKKLSEKNRQYEHPYVNISNASEPIGLLILLSLAQLPNPEGFILRLTHSDREENQELSSLGQDLILGVRKLKHLEAFIQLRRAVLELDQAKISEMLGNLKGAHKVYQTMELTLRKRPQDQNHPWLALHLPNSMNAARFAFISNIYFIPKWVKEVWVFRNSSLQ